MCRICLHVIFFFVLSPVAISQNAVTDSLYKLFLHEKSAVQKAQRFFDYAQIVMQNDPQAGTAIADTLEELGKIAKDQKSLARAMHLRGDALYEQGKYAEAQLFYKKELSIARSIKDLELQSRALNRIGGAQQNLGELDSAIAYLLLSAKIKEQLGDQKDIATIYSNIGNVFSDLKMSDKAIEWLEKSLAIRLSLPQGERGAIVCYNNLSVAYNGKGDYDKAIEYAQRGFDLAQETDNKFFSGVLAGSLGHLWLAKNDLDRSIRMSEKAVELLSEASRKPNLVFPLANLASAWLQKGNNAKAMDCNNRGYAIMQELKLIEPLEVYYENYGKIYESLGDYQQATSWYKKLIILDDSLFNKEKLDAVAEAEALFNSKKNEAQLIRQQLEIERQANQNKTILIVAIVALLVLAGGFRHWRNKQHLRQKEAELVAQLKHAEAEKLREMDSLKSTFFANISHEFRTPLTLILSPLEQMMSGTMKGDCQRYYRMMYRNGKHLLGLVNQLLELSKLESGKLRLQVSQSDLPAFVKAVTYCFGSFAVQKQINFKVVVQDDPKLCFFDKDKLEKILSNLISNAFKFTSEGKQIVVLVEMENETAIFSIVDEGMGIPQSQLPTLFERFAKSVSSELQSGSGIGLALTKELVELHKGKIEVESEEGKGTTFRVTLPTGASHYTAAEMATELPTDGEVFLRTAIPALEPPLAQYGQGMAEVLSADSKPLLLIVEDNPDVRSYLLEQFAGQYLVLEADNGKSGLRQALEKTPDLIISDIMMPEMDGKEFCRLLKTNEKTSHIPIIMLTALVQQHDRITSLELGADDYLIKPVNIRELIIRAANLIESRKKLHDHYRSTFRTFSSSIPVTAQSVDVLFLKKVRDAIEANLDDENFSVVGLSLQVGMSRSQLHRKLSALTGFSPNEVIRNMRLERAKELLKKKAGNASEVAYKTGFNSPAYFSKCFKDYFGITPGEVN